MGCTRPRAVGALTFGGGRAWAGSPFLHLRLVTSVTWWLVFA